jgi:SEC-C motif
MLIRREHCSVCGAASTPFQGCRHRTARVYGGRMCCRVVDECELISVSIVTEPVQTFLVLIVDTADGSDPSDYGAVKWVADRLTDPLDRWQLVKTASFHPHALFADRAADGACPCGSGRRYRTCCRGRPGVQRPHFDVLFSAPPPELPAAELLGYDRLQDRSARQSTTGAG